MYKVAYTEHYCVWSTTSIYLFLMHLAKNAFMLGCSNFTFTHSQQHNIMRRQIDHDLLFLAAAPALQPPLESSSDVHIVTSADFEYLLKSHQDRGYHMHSTVPYHHLKWKLSSVCVDCLSVCGWSLQIVAVTALSCKPWVVILPSLGIAF